MYCTDLLKDSTTTNIEINKLCKYLFQNLFIGVFSADEMPKLKNGTMCIINTDSSKKSGTHWVACYKYRNKIYMYDTFNRNVKLLSPYWKHKHNIIDANKNRDESFNAKTCGQQCISWLIVAHKYKPNNIMNII